MVAAPKLIIHLGLNYARSQPPRTQHIVEPHAFVLFAAAVPNVKEGVLDCVWIQVPKCVEVAHAQPIREGLALDWEEARRLFVFLGVVTIQVLVGAIQIPRYNHRLALGFQVFEEGPEVQIPLLRPILQPLERRARIRHIHANQEERFKLQRYAPAFKRVLGRIDVINHIQRLDLAEDDGAGVARDRRLATIPVLVVVRGKFVFQSFSEQPLRINFGFLQAQDVWLRFLEELLDAVFADDCTHAVHIPAVDGDLAQVLLRFYLGLTFGQYPRLAQEFLFLFSVPLFAFFGGL